jgi:hypothetical protein
MGGFLMARLTALGYSLLSILGVVAGTAGLPAKGFSSLPLLFVGFGCALVFGALAVRSYRSLPTPLRHPVSNLVALWVVSFIGTAVIFPVLLSARAASGIATCLSNQKAIAVALHVYAYDHDDHLPPAERWWDVQPHRERRCPTSHSPYTYAFNDKLGGMDLNKMGNHRIVMVFEADGAAPNLSGGMELLGARHNVCVRVDGTSRSTNGLTQTDFDPVLVEE